MSKRYHICLAIAALFLGAIESRAGDLTYNSDGSTSWQAGIDGVRIEWDKDGSFNRILSRISQPVGFPDRAGITKAQVIAEEKAKGAIVRFIEQDVATTRVVTEIQNDISRAERSRSNREGEKRSRTNQSELVESVKQITTSSAVGKLRGVIVLERGYDPKEEVAWVEVGVSKKVMNASRSLQEIMPK